MTSAIDQLFAYMRDVLYDPGNASLDVESLPDEFQMLGQGLQYFATCALETGALAKALSKGDLNIGMPSRGNELAAPLKSLHASLKHLTWQTQQVAKGDYRQRVAFMGDFAEAFNAMVHQLEQQRAALLEEIEAGRQKTHNLARSNSFFEAITGEIPQWIVVRDRETGETLFSNRPAAAILKDRQYETSLNDWLTKTTIEMPDDAELSTSELEFSHGDQSQSFSVAVSPLHWRERAAVAFVLTDISTEKEYLLELENVAYRDTMTKLYNRHYGMMKLGEWLGESKEFVICFVDMDNLKYVNDRFGHLEGDIYILHVSDILRFFSPGSIVCRLGGDEFLLLIPDSDLEEVETRLETLRRKLISESSIDYTESFSFGAIEVPVNNTKGSSDLLSVADEKMYTYKRAHKAQRQSIYSPTS